MICDWLIDWLTDWLTEWRFFIRIASYCSTNRILGISTVPRRVTGCACGVPLMYTKSLERGRDWGEDTRGEDGVRRTGWGLGRGWEGGCHGTPRHLVKNNTRRNFHEETASSNLGMLSQPPLFIPIPLNHSKDKYLISTYHIWNTHASLITLSSYIDFHPFHFIIFIFRFAMHVFMFVYFLKNNFKNSKTNKFNIIGCLYWLQLLWMYVLYILYVMRTFFSDPVILWPKFLLHHHLFILFTDCIYCEIAAGVWIN